MQKACCVPSCRNKDENLDGSIYFHRFPKSEDLRLEWFKRCGKVGKINYNFALVCSEHFTQDDYVQDIRVLARARPFVKLKATAVPSLKCFPCHSIDLPPCSSDSVDLPHDFTENPISEPPVFTPYSSNRIEEINEICKQLYLQRYFPDIKYHSKEAPLNIKRPYLKSTSSKPKSRKKRGKNIAVAQKLRRKREKQNRENVTNMFNQYFENGLTVSGALDYYEDNVLENESSSSFYPSIKDVSNMFAAWKRQKSFKVIEKFYSYFDDGFNASQAINMFEVHVLEDEESALLYPTAGQVNLMYKNWKKIKDVQSRSNEQNAEVENEELRPQADENMELGTELDENMDLRTQTDENKTLVTQAGDANCEAPNSTNSMTSSTNSTTVESLDDKSGIVLIDPKTVPELQLTTKPPVSVATRVPIYTPPQATAVYFVKEAVRMPLKVSKANYLKGTRVTIPKPSAAVLNTVEKPVNEVCTGIRIKEEPPEETPSVSTSTTNNLGSIPRIENVFSVPAHQNSLQNARVLLPNFAVIRNGAAVVDNSVQTDDEDVQLLLSLLPDLKKLPRSHKVNIKNKMQDVIFASRVSARRESLKHLSFRSPNCGIWKPKLSKRKRPLTNGHPSV